MMHTSSGMVTDICSNAMQTKLSFVIQVDDVYLGCGVYKTAAIRVA